MTHRKIARKRCSFIREMSFFHARPENLAHMRQVLERAYLNVP
jgi:hypothetical protein